MPDTLVTYAESNSFSLLIGGKRGFQQTGLFLTQDFGHIYAGRVGFEQVTGVILSAGSAATADFAVLAQAAFALDIALVPQFKVEIAVLKLIPYLREFLFFYVS